RAIAEPYDSGVLGAIGAAEDRVVMLDAMANHFAAAVGADWRQRVDGTLKGVEGVLLAVHGHGKSFVVLVPAYVTLRHNSFPPLGEDGCPPLGTGTKSSVQAATPRCALGFLILRVQ